MTMLHGVEEQLLDAKIDREPRIFRQAQIAGLAQQPRLPRPQRLRPSRESRVNAPLPGRGSRAFALEAGGLFFQGRGGGREVRIEADDLIEAS